MFLRWYLVVALVMRSVGSASLLRQVADVMKEKKESFAQSLVNSTFAYLFEPLLADEVLYEIKSVEDAYNAVTWAKERRRVAFRLRFDGGERHPKYANYSYRVGQYAGPVLDSFCAFFQYTIPALRKNRWPESYILISVGTIGLGSPWHPSIRKALQKKNIDIFRSGSSLLDFIEHEEKIRYYIVSQHWPQFRDLTSFSRKKNQFTERSINTWDPAKSLVSWQFSDQKTSSCISTAAKIIQIPLGYKWHVRAKSLAFHQVFLAATNAALKNISETHVEDPFFRKRILRFDADPGTDDVKRPILVKSAMRLHKGRAEKLRAFQRNLFLNVNTIENHPRTDKQLQNITRTSPMEFTQKPAGVYDDFLNYYSGIVTSKFVLSPVGTGLDCYRHWEALALGAIPIVDYSPITAVLFKDLPVLLLDSWDLPLSQAHYQAFYRNYVQYAGHTFHFEKLTVAFWQNLIKLLLYGDDAAATKQFISPNRCAAGPFLATCNTASPLVPEKKSKINSPSYPFRCRTAQIFDRLDNATLILKPTPHEFPGGRHSLPRTDIFED